MPVVMEAIDRMTTAEKVEVMNYLWASLSSTGDGIQPSTKNCANSFLSFFLLIN